MPARSKHESEKSEWKTLFCGGGLAQPSVATRWDRHLFAGGLRGCELKKALYRGGLIWQNVVQTHVPAPQPWPRRHRVRRNNSAEYSFAEK